MDTRGSTLQWVALTVMVVVFGAFVMQLRESVARANSAIREVKHRYSEDITDLKVKIDSDFKRRLEDLEKVVKKDIPKLKKTIEGSTSKALADKLNEEVDRTRKALEKMAQEQMTNYESLTGQLKSGQEEMKRVARDVGTGPATPEDCEAVFNLGHARNGVYKITDPTGQEPKGIDVYCDMTINFGGGGWTMLQRRRDYAVTFDRAWKEYKDGFGDMTSDFWLGNKYTEALTAKHTYELRIDLWDNKAKHVYAKYATVKVASEEFHYALTFGEYTGTAGDSLGPHQNFPFSTFDRDNDKFADGCCADMWKSGWWFTDCYTASLNGAPGFPSWNGVKWRDFHWQDDPAILKTEIKIRRVRT